MTDTREEIAALTQQGFARRVEAELDALNYPHNHVLRTNARILAALSPAPSYEDGLEAAAQVAEGFCAMSHIAQDMKSGIFPSRSNRVDAVAAAVRALKGKRP